MILEAGRRRYKTRLCEHGRVRAGASYIVGDSQSETDAFHSISGGGRCAATYMDVAEATIEACDECREA